MCKAIMVIRACYHLSHVTNAPLYADPGVKPLVGGIW